MKQLDQFLNEARKKVDKTTVPVAQIPQQYSSADQGPGSPVYEQVKVTIKKQSSDEPNVSDRDISYDVYHDGKYHKTFKDINDAMDHKEKMQKEEVELDEALEPWMNKKDAEDSTVPAFMRKKKYEDNMNAVTGGTAVRTVKSKEVELGEAAKPGAEHFKTVPIGNGEHAVHWKGKRTPYTIFNGSMGASGFGNNIYGIHHKTNGIHRTNGTLHQMKSVLMKALHNDESKATLEEAKDTREYDYEGDMALSQINQMMHHLGEMKSMVKPNTNLPEWVQSKITLACDYIQTATDYMTGESMKEEVELGEAKFKAPHDDSFVQSVHPKTGREGKFYHTNGMIWRPGNGNGETWRVRFGDKEKGDLDKPSNDHPVKYRSFEKAKAALIAGKPVKEEVEHNNCGTPECCGHCNTDVPMISEKLTDDAKAAIRHAIGGLGAKAKPLIALAKTNPKNVKEDTDSDRTQKVMHKGEHVANVRTYRGRAGGFVSTTEHPDGSDARKKYGIGLMDTKREMLNKIKQHHKENN